VSQNHLAVRGRVQRPSRQGVVVHQGGTGYGWESEAQVINGVFKSLKAGAVIFDAYDTATQIFYLLHVWNKNFIVGIEKYMPQIVDAVERARDAAGVLRWDEPQFAEKYRTMASFRELPTCLVLNKVNPRRERWEPIPVGNFSCVLGKTTRATITNTVPPRMTGEDRDPRLAHVLVWQRQPADRRCPR